MISCRLALCCDAVSRDSESNTVSAFIVLEEINTPGFPIVLPRLTCLFILDREANDPRTPNASLRITVSDEEIFRAPISIDFQQGRLTRVIGKINGFVVPKPGLIRVRLILEGVEFGNEGSIVGEWRMAANQIPQPKIEQVGPGSI